MDSARTFLRKVSALFRRERFQDELAQEVVFHREKIEAQLREEGVPAQAAQAAASRQFGNELRIGEKSIERVEFRFETTLTCSFVCGWRNRMGSLRNRSLLTRWQPPHVLNLAESRKHAAAIRV